MLRLQDAPADRLYQLYYRSLNSTQLAAAIVSPSYAEWHSLNSVSQDERRRESFAQRYEVGLAKERERYGASTPGLFVARALYLAAESGFLAAAARTHGAPDGGADGGGRAGWRRTRVKWAAAVVRGATAAAGHDAGRDQRHEGLFGDAIGNIFNARDQAGLDGLYSDAAAEMYRQAAEEEARAREAYYRAEEAYRQVPSRSPRPATKKAVPGLEPITTDHRPGRVGGGGTEALRTRAARPSRPAAWPLAGRRGMRRHRQSKRSGGFSQFPEARTHPCSPKT